MDFIYVITMTYDYNTTPDVYTSYEEAKKNFFRLIREGIIDNTTDPKTQEKELTKLNDFINHFDDEKLGEKVGVKEYEFIDENEESTFYTLQINRLRYPSHRVIITAWDGVAGWSPITCETCIIDKNEEELADTISLNREIWDGFIIPLGLKVVKAEGVYDEESDEEPESRVNGYWFIIKNDVYLADEELEEKLRELGIAEFIKQYGE